MFWFIVISVSLIAVCLDSALGKLVIGTAVIAIGLLLLRWITGLSLLVTLAKACAILIVVTLVGAILFALVH